MLGLLKNKKDCKWTFFTSHSVHVNGVIHYGDVIHSFHWKLAVKHDGGVQNAG